MARVVAQPDEATRPVRVVFPARVCFSGVEFQVKEFTANLSTGGIFLPTRQHIASGTIGKLTFRISRWEAPFTVDAEVVRTVNPGEETNGQQGGLGIQFVDVSEANQKKLERPEEPIRVLFCVHPSTQLSDAVVQLRTLPLGRLRLFERNMTVRPQLRAAAQEIVKKKSRGFRV